MSTAAEVEPEEQAGSLGQWRGTEVADGPAPAELCCVILELGKPTPPPEGAASRRQSGHGFTTFHLQLSQRDQNIDRTEILPLPRGMSCSLEQNVAASSKSRRSRAC